MAEIARQRHSQELHSSLRRTEQTSTPRRDLTDADIIQVLEKDFKDTELLQDHQFIVILRDKANEVGLPIELIADAMRDLDKQVEAYGQTEALEEHSQHQAETAQSIKDTKKNLKQRKWRDALASSRDMLIGIAINGWKEAAQDIGLGLASDIRQKKAEARQKTANMKRAMESVLQRAINKHQLETLLRTGGPGLRSIVERFQKGRIGLAEFMNDPELMNGIDSMINATDVDTLNEYVLERAPDGTPINVIDFTSYSPDKATKIKTAIKDQLRAVARHQIITLATEKSQAIVSSDDYEPNLPGVVGTGKSIMRRASLSGTLWTVGLRGGGKLAIGGALGAGVLTGGSGIAIAVGLGAITGAARAYINSEKQINRKRVDASLGNDTQQVEVGGQMEDVVKAASLIEAQLSVAIQEATNKQQAVAAAWADLQRQQLDANRIAAQGVPSPYVDDSDYARANLEMRGAMTTLYGILSDAHARLQRSRSLTKKRQDYISFGYHDRAQAISEFASKLEVGLSVVGTYVDNLEETDKADMVRSMTEADTRNTELVNAIEEKFVEKLKEGRGKKIIKGAVRGGAVAGAVSFAMDVMFGGDADAPADIEPIQPTIENGSLLQLNGDLHAVILTNELMISPNDAASDLAPQHIPLPADVDVTQVAFIPNADGSQINIVDAATGKSLHYINVDVQAVAPGDMVVDDPIVILDPDDDFVGYLNPDTPARFYVDGNTYVAHVEEESGIIEVFKQTTDGKLEKAFNTQSIYPEQVLDDPEKFPGLSNLALRVSTDDPHQIYIYSAINGREVAEFNIHEKLPEPPAAELPPATVAPPAEVPAAEVPPVAAPAAPVAPEPPVDGTPEPPASPVSSEPTPPVPPATPPASGTEQPTDQPGTGTPGKLEEPTKQGPSRSPSLEKPTDHGTPTTPRLEKPTGATDNDATGMVPAEKPSGPQVIEQAFANADTKAALEAIGVKPDAVTADDSGFHVSVSGNEYLSATEGWRQTRLELLMEAQRQGLINPGEKPLEILSRIEQATNLALNEKGAHLDHTAALQKAFGMDVKDVRGGVMKYVTGEKGAGVDSRWLTVVEQVAKLPKAVAVADIAPASVAPPIDLGSATGQIILPTEQRTLASAVLETFISSAHAEPLPGGMAVDGLRVTPIDLSTTLRPVGEQFIQAGMESGGGVSVSTIVTSTLFEQVAPLQDKAAKVKPAPHPELNPTTNLPEPSEVEYGRVQIYEKPFADPVVAMQALEESEALEGITPDIDDLEYAVSVARLPRGIASNSVTEHQRRTERDVKTRYSNLFRAFERMRNGSKVPDRTNIPGTRQTIGELERQLSNRIVVAGVQFGYGILRRSERFSKQLKKDVDEYRSRAEAYAGDATVDPNTKLVELRRRQAEAHSRFRDFKDLIDADLQVINEDPAVVVTTDFDAVISEVRLTGLTVSDLERYLSTQIYDLEDLVNPVMGTPIRVLPPLSAGPLPAVVTGPPTSSAAPTLRDPFADPDYDIPVFGDSSDPDDEALFGDMALPSGVDAGVDPNFSGWPDPEDEWPVDDDEAVGLPAPSPDVGISSALNVDPLDPATAGISGAAVVEAPPRELTEAERVRELGEKIELLRAEISSMLVVGRLLSPADIQANVQLLETMNALLKGNPADPVAVNTERARLIAEIRGTLLLAVKDWYFDQCNQLDYSHHGEMIDSRKPMSDRLAIANRPNWADTTHALLLVRNQISGSGVALAVEDRTTSQMMYRRLEGLRMIVDRSVDQYRRMNSELRRLLTAEILPVTPAILQAVETITAQYTPMQAAAFYRRISTHIEIQRRGLPNTASHIEVLQAAGLVGADGTVNEATLQSLQLKTGSSEMHSDTYMTDRDQSYSSMETYIGDVLASAVHDQNYRETMVTQANAFDSLTGTVSPLFGQFRNTPGGRAVLPDGRYSKVAKHGTQYHILRAFELIPSDATPDTAELIPAKVDAFVKALLANQTVTPNSAIVADSMYKLTYGKEGAVLTPEASPVVEPAAERAEQRERGYAYEVGEYTEASQSHPMINEDTILVDTDLELFGVFDGNSNPPGGNIAAEYAKRFIRDRVRALAPNLDLEQTQDAIFSIVTEANRYINELVLADPVLVNVRRADRTYESKQDVFDNSKLTSIDKAGTTVALVKMWHGQKGERKAIVAHAGDSRVYKRKVDGTIELLTLDDCYNVIEVAGKRVTLTNDRLKELLTKYARVEQRSQFASDEEKAFLKIINKVTSGLGGFDSGRFKPTVRVYDLAEGEELLLTTDGVHDQISDTQIENTMNAFTQVNDAANKLVKRSRAAGDAALFDGNARGKGHDDAAAIRIREVEITQRIPDLAPAPAVSAPAPIEAAPVLAPVAPITPEPKPVGGPASPPPPEGPPAGDPAIEQQKLLDKANYLVETMYSRPLRDALSVAMDTAGMDTAHRIEVCNFALAEGRKASINLVGDDKLSGRRLVYALGIRNIDDVVDTDRINEVVAEIIKLQPPFEDDQQMVMDESTARLTEEVARVLGEEFGGEFASAITNQILKGTNVRTREINRITALGNFAFRWSELRRNKLPQVGTVMALTGNELLAAFGWHNGVDTLNTVAIRATAQRALDGLTPVFDSAQFVVATPEAQPAAPAGDRPVEGPVMETTEMIAQREYEAMMKELSGDDGGFAKLKTAREHALANEFKPVASQTSTEHEAARQVGSTWKRAFANLEDRVKHYQGLGADIKTVRVGDGSKKTIKAEAEKYWNLLHIKDTGEKALMHSAIEAWSMTRVIQFGNELQADLTAKDVAVVDRIALVANQDGKFRKLYAQLDEDFNLLNRYPRSDAAVLEARAVALKAHADLAEVNVKIADRWAGQMRAVETAFGDDVGRAFLTTFATEISAGSPAEQFKVYGRLLDHKSRSQTSEVALKAMKLIDDTGAVNPEEIGEFIGEAIRERTEDEETVDRLGKAAFARFGGYMTDRLRETVGALPVERQRELLERLIGAVEVPFEAARDAHKTMLQGAPHNLRGRNLDEAMRSRESTDTIRQATLEPILLAVSSGGPARENMDMVVERLIADVPVEGLFAGLIDQEAAVREINTRLDTVGVRLGKSMTESVDTALRPLELPKQLELLDTLLSSVQETFEGLVTTNAGSVDKARHAILRQLHLATELGELIPDNIAEVTTRLLAGKTGEALFAGLLTERVPDPEQLERDINKRLRIVEVRLGTNMRDGLAQDLTDVEPVRAFALINELLNSTRMRFEALVGENSGNERAARAALLRELHLATDRDVLITNNMQDVSNRLQAGVVGPALFEGLVAEVKQDPVKLEQNRDRRLGIVERRFGPRMRNGLAGALAAEPMERQVALLNTLLESTAEQFDALVEANGGNTRTARDLLMIELHMATDRGNPIGENLQTVGERLLAGTTGMELYAGLTSEIVPDPARLERDRDRRVTIVGVRFGRRMQEVLGDTIGKEDMVRQVQLLDTLLDSVKDQFVGLVRTEAGAEEPTRDHEKAARNNLMRQLNLTNERDNPITENLQEVANRLLAGKAGADLYAGLTTEVRKDPARLEQDLRKRFSTVVWRFGGRMRDILQDRINGVGAQPLERQIALTETLLDAVKDRFDILVREQAGTEEQTQDHAKAARDLLMRELNLTNLNNNPINENIVIVMERLLAGVTGMELFAGLTVGGRRPRGGDQGGPAGGGPSAGPDSGRGPDRGPDRHSDIGRTGRTETGPHTADEYTAVGATMDYMMADIQRTPPYGYLVAERIADQGVLKTLHNEVNLGGKLFHEALRPFHEALVTFTETGPALIARFHLDTLPSLRTLGTEMRTPDVTADRLRMILLSFETTPSGGLGSGPDGDSGDAGVDPIRNLVTAPADAHPRFFEAVRGVLGEPYVNESSVRNALGLGVDRADIEIARRVLLQLQTANVVDGRGRIVLDRKAVLAGDLGAKETTDSAIVEALQNRVGTLRVEVMGLLDTTNRAAPAVINVIAERLEKISGLLTGAMDLVTTDREPVRKLIADLRGVESLAIRDWLDAQANVFERDYNGVMRNAGRSLTDRVAIAGRPHWVEAVEPLKRVYFVIGSRGTLPLNNRDEQVRLYRRIDDLITLAKITPDRYTFQRGQLRRAIGDNTALGEAIGEVATPLSLMQAAAYYRRLVTHIETRGIDTLLGGDKKPDVKTLRSLSFEQDAVAKASDVNILQRDKQGGYAYSYIGGPAFSSVNERIYLDNIGEQTKLFSTLTEHVFPVYKRFGDIPAVKALKTDPGKELVNFHVLRALELVPANATQTLEPVPARVDKLVANLRSGKVEINTAVVEDSMFTLSEGKEGKALAAASSEPPPGDDPDGGDTSGTAEEVIDRRNISIQDSRLEIPRTREIQDMEDTIRRAFRMAATYTENVRITGDRFSELIEARQHNIRRLFSRLQEVANSVLPVRVDQPIGEYYDRLRRDIDEIFAITGRLRTEQEEFAEELNRRSRKLVDDFPKLDATAGQMRQAARIFEENANVLRRFSNVLPQHLEAVQRFLAQPGTVETAQPAPPARPDPTPIVAVPVDAPPAEAAAAPAVVEPTGPRPVDLPPAPGTGEPSDASATTPVPEAAPVRTGEVTMLNRYLPDLAHFDSDTQELLLEGGDIIDMRVGDFTCAVTVVESARNHEITFTYPENNYLIIGASKSSKQTPDMRLRVGGRERKVATERGVSAPIVDAILTFVNEMQEYYARTHPEDATNTVDYDEVTDPEAMEQNRPVRLQTFQDLFGQPSRADLEKALDTIEANDNRNMANATLLALMENIKTRLTAAGGETLKTQTARRTALDFGSGKKIDAANLASLVAEARAEFVRPDETSDTVDTPDGDISADVEDVQVIDPERLETMKVDLLGAIEPVRTMLASVMEPNGTTYLESVGRLSGILEAAPRFPQQNNFITRLGRLSRNMESIQQVYRESVAVTLQRLDSDIPEHGIDVNVMTDISSVASELNTLQESANADFDRTTTLGVDLMTKLTEYETRNRTATEGSEIKTAVGSMIAPMKKIRDVLHVAAPDMASALALAQSFQEEIDETSSSGRPEDNPSSPADEPNSAPDLVRPPEPTPVTSATPVVEAAPAAIESVPDWTPPPGTDIETYLKSLPGAVELGMNILGAAGMWAKPYLLGQVGTLKKLGPDLIGLKDSMLSHKGTYLGERKRIGTRLDDKFTAVAMREHAMVATVKGMLDNIGPHVSGKDKAQELVTKTLPAFIENGRGIVKGYEEIAKEAKAVK